MIFQIVDWNYFHEEDDDGIKQYKIRLFGRTKDNKTIYVCVENFNPYFYIEIDKTMRKEKIEQLINDVKKKVYPKENVDGLIKYELEEHHNLYGFTNSAKFPFLKLIFTSFDAFRSYERVFNKPIRNKKYRLFESNIEPFLRCMHIQNLDAVGWVEIKDDRYDTLDKNITCCDINISTDYRNLNRYEERIIMPLVIASFDIECVSEDGSFPQPERDNDKIIQIGTTFSKFGETDCYYKHIVTLGKCNKLEGVDIESFQTEKEMLLAWTDLLRRTNPDVITGYNIFGFDFEYMMKRAEKLGISRKFSRLSRITGEECKWQEKKLASSALGDNILKYYDMTGRIIIDLMKVAQRDFKLASYKLDYVASSFIKEGIQKLELDKKNNKTTIHTKSTYGVVVDQFITVFYNDSITDNKHMDGKKFKILELESNKLVVDGLIEDDIMSMGYKVFWCQAKDDISPQDIFDYQKKNPLTEKCKYRTVIAKYCIQDNVLCNKLMAKLQVLTNNIGMANVCHVPLSYLFMRGQGVKIFSLVSRRCRLENHLIPVLKKPKKEEDIKNKNVFDMKDGKLLDNFVDELNNKENDIEEEDEDNKYEGAIVFPPKKGVYFEPIPVLDYNSLYPNSMVQRNLSHECNILDNTFDEKYGYLKSHKYHEIVYNTTYVFDEIYKELKDDNVYIDFFRLILSTFIPRIKVDYSQLLDEDELSMDSSSIGSKNKNKKKTNTIIVKYKNDNDEYIEEKIIVKDEKISDNLKYIVKDSFKNLSAIIKIIMLNISRLMKIFLNKEIKIKNNKEHKKFEVYTDIFKKERLWIELEYTLKHEKIIIYKVCKFAEKSDGTKGIIPQILIGLLDARKKYKNEMEEEKDYFKKSILDGLQLAYKVTANSLYGQTGAPTSAIFMKDIAAATTATGRQMLQFSRYFIEEQFGPLINYALTNKKKYLDFANKTFDTLPYKIQSYGSEVQVHIEPNVKIPDKRWNNPRGGYNNREEFFEVFYKEMNKLLKSEDKEFSVDPKIIYGDTDSVFFNPKITDTETGEVQKDKKSLEMAIQLGVWASETICKLLPDPQKQAYEKVLYPFAILTKKRYVGNLYETDPNKYYQKSMGIVLKRRDNAPIVKVVVGGIINEIMNKKSAQGAVEYTKKTLKQILMNKYAIDKFIITKTLREKYADRTRITHAVLADRMAKRDPGNKPLPNDRIPYAYIQVDREVDLQGDRVEHPEFIAKNDLKLDYLFYITNQIMIPSVQFLELLVSNPETIFDEYILREQNRRKGFKPVSFFLKTKENSESDSSNVIDIDNDDNLEKELKEFEKNKKLKKPTNRKTKKETKIIKEDSSEDEFYL
jgi:DNA polymerase elongation subunit (family B)